MASCDWANGGFVDVFWHGEYGFSSMGSCCYSREQVWNSRTKLSQNASEVKCHASEKVKVLWFSLLSTLKRTNESRIIDDVMD